MPEEERINRQVRFFYEDIQGICEREHLVGRATNVHVRAFADALLGELLLKAKDSLRSSMVAMMSESISSGLLGSFLVSALAAAELICDWVAVVITEEQR